MMRAMQQKHAVSTTAALILAALTATPAPIAAQEAAAAWRVECSGDGKILDCRAVQQLFQRDTRQLLVSMLVRKAPDPKAALVTLQLPLGLNLT
jgi:invasion protein IalB